MALAREILDDLPEQRFQENTARELDKQKNSGTVSGCISGDKVKIGENSWRVSHGLGVEPKGFVIIAQGTSSSLKAEMSNMTTDTVEISFTSVLDGVDIPADPTSFTLFLY